ncbi:phytoene desaturase family protein [Streptosporangium canum]|uniref:phytoene desaturase family protein n=1 Tax=Streptosporangium canum TaxID=324952 RepID=UPI0034467518
MNVPVERRPPAWDVIVIGAGVGGLVCAAYLAASGRRVLVVEQHDVAGGNGHAFRRRSYRFDVGVHYLGDCGPDGILPAILNGLGLRDRVRFLEMDRDGFDRIVTPSLTVDVPAGWPRYRRRLVGALPREADGITRFTGICEGVADAGRRSLLAQGLDDVTERWRELRWARRPLAELFDHCGLSAVARTVLAAQSGNYGAAPRDVSVATHAAVTDHYLRGAYRLAGGGQTLVASLVEVLEAHGGELWTRCAARRVSLDDGGVRGVELADGRRIAAPVVVSNADYRRTILELCDDGAGFPPRLLARARASTMRLPWAVLYIALDVAKPYTPDANVWWFPGEDIERSYARLHEGVRDELPFVFVSFAPEDGGRAHPAGHSSLQVMTVCPPGHGWWGMPGGPADGVRYRRDPAYLAAKRGLTEAMLTAAEKAVGPLRDHIVHLEAATPLTHERYTLSSGGTPYGLNSWGAPGHRPDRRPGVGTSVPGLYVVGQSTHFGSGITGVAVSGIMCASRIAGRPLLPEVHAGVTFGDPSLLPARPAGWDPPAVSRGRGRRGARGRPRLPETG